MDDTQAFKQWLDTIHKSILGKSQQGSYTYLYGIDIYSNDITTLFGGKSDVYELINQDSTSAYFHIYDMLAFVAFGWAAPVDNEDVAPSQHSEKRRVVLTNYISSSSRYLISAINFTDETDTVWEYDNSTQGSLKEALYGLYS